jgi:hypothetical protein
MLGVMGIALLALHFFRIRQRKKNPPTALTGDILRGPGQSLLTQIDSLNQEIQVYSIALPIIPILIFCAHISYSYFGRQPESVGRIAMSAGGALAFMGHILLKLMPLLAKRRMHRLSYEGKVVAGQELNLLMSDGYRIFHDFPADNFNIDHIVVGPTGVMAVKTETCKVRNPNRLTDALVAYDGRMLHFPKFSDFETIEQANRQAEWLSEWLSSTAGEDVCARAMVAVPGWSVKRTSADGIPVVNPKQFATLFKHIKPRPMSQSLMQRIVRQIEGRCHS